jgi:hypothetical protein
MSTQTQTSTQTTTQSPKQNPVDSIQNGLVNAPSTETQPNVGIIVGAVSSTVAIIGIALFAVYQLGKARATPVISKNPTNMVMNPHVVIPQNTTTTRSSRVMDREQTSFEPTLIRGYSSRMP